MRRSTFGILAVAGILGVTTACTESSMFATGEGVLPSATRGIVISDSGTDANAGMDSGNTCFVNPKNGWLGTERDYPGYQDEVEDIGRHLGQDVILVATDRGLHVTPADPSSYEVGAEYVVDGVIEARLAGDDLGVLVQQPDGCVAGWYGTNTGAAIDDSACTIGRLEADPDLGDLFASTDLGVVHVPKGGTATVVDAEADLAVFDSFTGLLYTAEEGGTWVRATDSAGAVSWTTDLGLPVIDLDDLGWREGVAALVQAGDVDQVWTIDAWTGEAVLADETPPGATAIVTSRNGRSFGLVGDSQVAFRELARHERD